MYDEFGNLKKKFRVKAHQAEVGQVLPGTGRAGWEVEELGTTSFVISNARNSNILSSCYL